MEFDVKRPYLFKGWAVVEVEGRIDINTGFRVRERLIDTLTHGENQVVVNLEKVELIDSFGWGIFLAALKRARHDNGDLRLAGLNGAVKKQFKSLDFHEAIPCFSTVEQAVEAEG